MNPYVELAELFKERNNPIGYSPIYGKIIRLPNLTIECGNKILLDKSDIDSIIDLYKRNDDGYIYLNKRVLLLPLANEKKFVVIGVLHEHF